MKGASFVSRLTCFFMWMSSCSVQLFLTESCGFFISVVFYLQIFHLLTFFGLWITYYKEILFSVLKVLEPKHLLLLKNWNVCKHWKVMDGSLQKHFEDPGKKPQACSGSVSGWDEGSHSNAFFRTSSWESALAAQGSVKAETMESAVAPADTPGSFPRGAPHTDSDCQAGGPAGPWRVNCAGGGSCSAPCFQKGSVQLGREAPTSASHAPKAEAEQLQPSVRPARVRDLLQRFCCAMCQRKGRETCPAPGDYPGVWTGVSTLSLWEATGWLQGFLIFFFFFFFF